MKIVAAVNYFDEPLEHTDRLLESLQGFVDGVVLVDGAYRLFPHDIPYTDEKRLNTIHETSVLLDLNMTIVSIETAWTNQTTKRSYMMNAAADAGDYVLVIDADEWVDREATDIERLLYKINMHRPDAISVCLDTPDPPRRRLAHNLATQSPQMSTSVHGKGVERIYRSMTDIIVGPLHHGSISGVNELGDRISLRSRKTENARMEQALKLDAKDYFRIVNSTWERDATRMKQKGVYGQQRARAHEDK